MEPPDVSRAVDADQIADERQQLERLSIRARMAIAVACFERALRRLGVAITPDIATLLEVLWQFPAANDLAAWEHDLTYAAAPGLAWNRTVDGPEDLDVLSGVDPRLRRLYDDVDEVGHGNLYCGYRSQFTLEPLPRVIAATRALGVAPPSPTPLCSFTYAEYHGWGRPIVDAAQRLQP